MKYPLGILEDVVIKMGDFYVVLDFMILDIAIPKSFLGALSWPLPGTN